MNTQGLNPTPRYRRESPKLDEDLLRVLSSSTRVLILRKLSRRQMTLSDLARVLDFSKSTIHEHLIQLIAAGLIYPITGRKWIYYRLSRKGIDVVGLRG
jgi:DNA-binding transcriptional ArsR family regulator